MCQQESKLEHRSCPHFQAWDEGPDLCEVNDKICLMEEGNPCSIWDEIEGEKEKEMQECESILLYIGNKHLEVKAANRHIVLDASEPISMLLAILPTAVNSTWIQFSPQERK